MDSCSECGFVYDEVPMDAISGRLRGYPTRYRSALARAAAIVARRPAPAVWSALEYACHVRDVLLVQRDRGVLARVEDRPSLARMYRDERVEICHYAGEDIHQVLADVDMAARLCATVFDDLNDAVGSRTLVYNWPEPMEKDLAWLGRHTVHEAEHHLGDVAKVVAAVASQVEHGG